jgi:hypothetical protein
VPSPSAGGNANPLYGIAVIAPNDIWAVGPYSNGTIWQTLIEHWNGATWSVVPSPNPGIGSNFLFDVAGVAANDVWAVGRYSNTFGPDQTLIEHWDGTNWSVVSSPNAPSYDDLRGVTAVAGNDVWAVGAGGGNGTLVEHWDGASWTIIPAAAGYYLNDVAAVAANDVWAVGYTYGSVYHTQIQHWDGSTWSVVPSPNVGTSNNVLYGSAVVAANDIWAVGCAAGCGSLQQALILHWDGASWAVVPNPSIGTGGYALFAAAALTGADVWAVGFYMNDQGPYFPLTEHWDGSSWAVVPGANPGTGFDILRGVAALTTTSVWAIGNSNAQTLTEHYGCLPPSPTATATSTLTGTATPAHPPTASPTNTLTASATDTPTNTPTNPATPTNTATASPTGTAPPATATATLAPTVTSTPVATPPSRLLVGHVTWQARGGAQPSVYQMRPITLTLQMGATLANYPNQMTDATGHFTVTVSMLPSGVYTGWVKGPQYLANVGTLTLAGAPVTPAEFGLLRVGDANGDNLVDIMDFTILRAAFGQGCGDAGYDPRAEFTDDCLVDVVDFTWLRSNFGQFGPPQPTGLTFGRPGPRRSSLASMARQSRAKGRTA